MWEDKTEEQIGIDESIIIQIDDDITVEQLSEGEKKLILVKTVLEILSDEKTLVLMDEPDAHLHEGRKPALCNMMREYPNRQIVIPNLPDKIKKELEKRINKFEADEFNECVESAKVMATVYTAIAAFENMVRQFVVKILMENKGENWWTECVSDKIRKSADSRKAEEDKIKWHTHRGTSMINYVDFADLANIMGQNYDLFEVHIVSLEWAKQIFTTLEKSRNVIMHSGELGERDIERIGINIRDWISQVGA